MKINGKCLIKLIESCRNKESQNKKALILRWAYYLDAFNSHPLYTWLPSICRGHDNWHTRSVSFLVLSY
ncbi:hypothetical protein K1719_000004 [Acacia pycnantha]|nr:hypothetical protein K1719_000004 [Acacia pycnantha]